ncbi:hypothetical protein GCM10027432_18430 [Lysobacter fragariae]
MTQARAVRTALLAAMVSACTSAGIAQTPTANPTVVGTPRSDAKDVPGSTDNRIVFPPSASQGAMVLGKVPVGSQVTYGSHQLHPTPYGTVVFGVGRDEKGPVSIAVVRPDGSSDTISIAVTPRDWPIENINGVPPSTVNPPPEIAERIQREQVWPRRAIATTTAPISRKSSSGRCRGASVGASATSASTTARPSRRTREWTSPPRPARR